MKGRCSVRGGLEQIRGEAFSIYLKWESVSVRQGCEWPNEALRSGQDPHHPKPIAASRSANKVYCTPRVWCITKMWRGAVQGLKWSHASSVVCSANPKKKKQSRKMYFLFFLFFPCRKKIRKHKNSAPVPRHLSIPLSTWPAWCMPWCSRCNSAVQLPPCICHHSWWLSLEARNPSEKKTIKNTSVVQSRNATSFLLGSSWAVTATY